MRALLRLTFLLLVTACAGRRQQRDALAAADARVLEGCYDCLIDARARYEGLATSKHISRDTVLLRLFETELLIALREKELQLDAQPAIQRARALGVQLPRTIDAARLVALADAVLPDATGRMPDWTAPTRARIAPLVERLHGELLWLETAPLREPIRRYLALAADCSHGGRTVAPPQPAGRRRRPVLLPGAPPVVQYRTAICVETDTTMLRATRAQVRTFPEAAFHIGAMAAFNVEETGGADAAELLNEARARFPRSPSVAYMSGWLASNAGECPAAIGYFEQAIAIDSTHELAWLQRTICNSKLKQDSAALESATRLIALGTGFAGQGHYWRAVSQLRLGNLPAARSDIEVAKRLARGANTLTIAGIIEHDQDDLTVAQSDLLEARAEPRGDENCTAAWYLGLVHAKQQRHGESATAFAAAMRCYDIKVSDIRNAIAHLESRPARYPEVRAKRMASMVADSLDNRSRYFAAAFNAAGNFASAGNTVRAVELLDVAATDPKLADPVTALRGALSKRASVKRRPTAP